MLDTCRHTNLSQQTRGTVMGRQKRRRYKTSWKRLTAQNYSHKSLKAMTTTRVEMSLFNRGLRWMHTEGESGTMFGTLSVFLKSPHRYQSFNVVLAERSFLWVYSRWQQRTAAGPCADPSYNAQLPHCHDGGGGWEWEETKKRDFQTVTLLTNVNSIVAKSNMTVVAAMAMDRPIVVSAPRQICVAHAVHQRPDELRRPIPERTGSS